MAFVFYDTETTGTHVHFDQILQFAAILTDNDLNELDRFEIRSKLRPNVVASPGAMKVTGITVEQLDNPNYPSHYEMVCQIERQLLEWQPAQFIGHNSLEFDEILLRSAFYKSLLPPYLTNTNGNIRLDTLRMLQSAYMYERDGIVFPTGPNGKVSFKLDRLAPANGFNHPNAHEAMADVEATIFMCRKLRDAAPETWSRTMRFANKHNAIDFCETEELFGLTEFYFGKPYTFILCHIGRNPDDGNEIIAFDLSNDPDQVEAYGDRELTTRITTSPKLIRRPRANALPGLIDADEAHPLSNASDIPLDELERRAIRLAEDKSLKTRLVKSFLDSKPEYDDSPHVEENIYSGFANSHDKAVMEEFHDADWPECYEIICRFEDVRFREIGEQIIFFEAPEHLSEEIRERWRRRTTARLLGTGEPCDALTLPAAVQQADDLLENAVGENRDLLNKHRERLVAQLQQLQLASG